MNRTRLSLIRSIAVVVLSAVVPALAAAECGNALLNVGEGCDDGNSVGGDGCSATCEVEPGYGCSTPSLSNLIADPGFEAGRFAGVWEESSTYFDTPICSVALCGSGQRNGEYWAWFGGVSDPDPLIGTEDAVVLQQVAIPEGVTEMAFWLRAADCDSAADYLELKIGADQAWEIRGDDPSCGELSYSQRFVDVSQWADNIPRDIQFHAETFALQEDWSNFYLDDIELILGSGDPVPSECELLSELIFSDGFETLP
jgi:cysteine-rich repeat protein